MLLPLSAPGLSVTCERTRRSEILLEAIRAAARGPVQFSALVREVQAPLDEPEHLTLRELDVLQQLADGLANKEIAWKLRISQKTVKSHVSTILSKCGLESRTQAAQYATRMGLVSGGSVTGSRQLMRLCTAS